MLWELYRKRFEENRENRKLCHLNPFEFFDHTRCYSCHFDSHAGRRLNQNFTRRVEIRRLGTMSQMFDYRTNRDLPLGNRRVPVENDFIVPRRGVRVYAGRYSWAKKKIPVHFSDDSLT